MRNTRKTALAARSHDPDVVDSTLKTLAKSHSALDVEIGEWLVIADDMDLDQIFGYASIFEYGDRVFGWTHRTTFDRLRVARKLQTLVATRDALSTGKISWSIAREISRVSE